MADGWLKPRLVATWADRWIVLQIGAAAGLAWFIAGAVLGQANAFFAPAAAVLVVSGSIGKQVRQTAELIVGVAVGLILADGLVRLIGRGPLQLALVVILAASLALVVSGGRMVLNQATTTAVLILALYPHAGGGIFWERWIDALIGAGVALVIRAVVEPRQPLRAVRRAADAVHDRLGEAFEGGTAAVRNADPAATLAAAERLHPAEAALKVLSEETTRAAHLVSIGLLHHRTRLTLARVDAAAPHLRRAIDNLHQALRHESAALGVPLAPGLLDAMAALDRASDDLLRDLVNPAGTWHGAQAARQAQAWAGRAERAAPPTATTAVAGHLHAAAGQLLLAGRHGPFAENAPTGPTAGCNDS
ncbi:uncharacterized membrane protein YgaE (UPF0421/DUF939 family) [Asanoa ferruginea]|uniref:Uncharacterized membrane protein YgaE (UPF0421/DUF939 family) n=1 Tax=Asanoa ferruginea TaxID=53367 RepID=A0A3D9ZJF8_9ACTN|nr:FUSC family protein [Asanoa ferruginea]REF97415.1 uncharacterized membrane protein YgaE (UPF0421/DUF939 family) [Asanoa ferruginea]GIF48301.1 hypothetical protein Afe04nite_28400 [Asanoa ferruginea]